MGRPFHGDVYCPPEQKLQFWTETWEKPGGMEEANDGNWEYWIFKIMLFEIFWQMAVGKHILS